MSLFTLSVDIAHGLAVQVAGFDTGVSFEGGTRADIRASWRVNQRSFYLSGACYSYRGNEWIEKWLARFDPGAIPEWTCELDGDITIIVVDSNAQTAYLISDRNGPARAYYTHERELVFISNSRQDLIRLLPAPRLSSFAIYQLLTMCYVVDPESLLENVRVTKPGQIVRFGLTGSPSVHQYYSPVQLECDYFRSESECVRNLDIAYLSVFQKRLGRVRTPCVLLSGGIDSLALMKYVKECYSGKVLSLTYSFKGLQPNELEPARMAARHFGTEHHEVVIDPENADALFLQNLVTDAPDAAYLTSFAIRPHLASLDGAFDLFTGQDTRLHTPPFDNPRELGVYLNRSPKNSGLLRFAAARLSGSLPHWPIEGSFKHYLQYWANNLRPRPDLSTYVLEALTPFHRIDAVGNGNTFHRDLVREMPDFLPEDGLQQIFKKVVTFNYRGQYTDDMNCLFSTLAGPVSRVHCPFYDWQIVTTVNRVPYALAMRGDFTFKTWNKMPYVRKRMARLLLKQAVPDALLYRAKKTCPHLQLIFNSSMTAAAQAILEPWLPRLLQAVDSQIAAIINRRVAEFASKSRFNIYDDFLLRQIQNICYLAGLQRLCDNPTTPLEKQLEAVAGNVRMADDRRPLETAAI